MMAGIETEKLVKRYGTVTALDGITINVPDGTIHAVAGPNGSGKTTLLGILAGLVSPTTGEVVVPEGAVGYGFQRPNVYPDLSVRENLAVFGALVDADPDWRDSLAEALRLDPVIDREAGALSDGYRKKLDLALAMLRRPGLLLLDEPLADLDDLTSRRLVDLVESLAEPGRTILVSTHDLETFASVLDGITVLYDGRVIETAQGAEVEPVRAYESALVDRG